MSAIRKPEAPLLMSAEEFLDWSAENEWQWELHDGHPVMMSPESTNHGTAQLAIVLGCERALPESSPCVASQAGKIVRTGAKDYRIPDVHIDCAPGEDRNSGIANEPVVIFEVSVTSADYDLGDKRGAYFANPFVRHYVVVIPEIRQVFHWRRGSEKPTVFDGTGMLDFDSPGIRLDTATFWAERPGRTLR